MRTAHAARLQQGSLSYASYVRFNKHAFKKQMISRRQHQPDESWQGVKSGEIERHGSGALRLSL
jgi:hypothetical protein